MFDPSLIGCVNANAVGGHAPETLIVDSPGVARKNDTGWNHIRGPGGGLYRVVTKFGGQPMFRPAPMTEDDLDGVLVVPHVPMPISPRVLNGPPRPFDFPVHGEWLHAEPEAPHVVEG